MSSTQQSPQPGWAPRNPQQSPPVKKKGRRWVPWAAGGAAFFVGVALGSAPSAGQETAASGAAPATVTASQAPRTVTSAPETVTAPPPAPETITLPAPAPVTVTVTPEPQDSFPGSGTFVVGEDIQPGTYRSSGGGGNCYWARLSGLGGSFSEIISNGNSQGPTVVTIAPSDAGFETQGCGTWARS